MNTEEITGGVSPLKKKWKGKASRGSSGQKRSIKGKLGGAAGIRNTSTKKGRRGFSKTGAKGSNVHGYGALTRFKPIVTKDYKGPLASATTPKTGGGGGNGGGGGGDTYNTTYGDDYSQHQSWENVGNYTEADLEANKKDKNTITNKTNTKVKTDVDQTNKNTTKQKIKTKEKTTYRQSFEADKENLLKKHGSYENYKKAAIAWNNSPAGKKYWANKNKTNQSNESNVDVDASTSNTSNVSSDQNVSRTGGTINIDGGGFFRKNPNPNQYDPSKRSPNKMKSHAWNLTQVQKKARGGTQKY
jgi:hypothetical protein